ncbi:hypothetical protein Trydic_g20805 [Trypoxylus dichotomus]
MCGALRGFTGSAPIRKQGIKALQETVKIQEAQEHYRNTFEFSKKYWSLTLSEMILILLLILGLTLLYWKTAKHYAYWTERNVKQRKQVYFLGDNSKIFLGKESIYEAVVNIYNAFPNERYMGIYQVWLPTLVVRDPDLIKQLTVKDFDHFLNHRAFIPEGVDPLWNKNLFALKDTQWREMRSTLSPSFTSSKMKMIFTLISECADDFMNYFLEKGEAHVLEMKDTFTRYTNDVIASVAFGIKCDSVRERDNVFFTMGTKATKFGPATNFKFLLYVIAPKLSKLLGIAFFPKEVTQFFFNVVMQTIQMRESQGIVRPDMLNLLLEARKNKNISDLETNTSNGSTCTTSKESNTNKEDKAAKHYLSDMDIVAQALVFFFGGFESVATLMSFAAYELTLNPECQRELQTEIDETLKECNGQLTYEAVMKMKYMDMVLSETLRKWPAAVVTDRVCSKDYTIEPIHSHEKPIHLKTGDLIWIPICGIHNDPKYYPDPEKFNPMRFSDDNKANLNPYTYLPFGTGPRNCIGSRFALMETKTILFYMLLKFDLNICKKTDIPIQLNKKAMQLITKNGIWIELKPRIK